MVHPAGLIVLRGMLRIALPMFLCITGCRQQADPPAQDDGRVWPDSLWKRSSYAERGIDSTLILELVDSLREFRFGAVHSLLIVKDGYLVTEEYFGADGEESARPLEHISSSILSALVGIAIERQELPQVDAKLSELLPDYGSYLQGDPLKRQITLEHLLRMTPGIGWEIPAEDYMELEAYDRMYGNGDPLKYFFQLPALTVPGTTFQYNNGAHLATTAALIQATGIPVEQYAQRHLFEKIGITSGEWNHVGDMANGAHGLTMTARDLARFGLLYARGGMWRSEHVVPATWVIRSTRSNLVIDSLESAQVKYGYNWWIFDYTDRRVNELFPHGFFMALGSGEQMLCVVPDLDLAIVMVCSKLATEAPETKSVVLAFKYLLPSIIGRPMNDWQTGEEPEESGPEEEEQGEEEYRETHQEA